MSLVPKVVAVDLFAAFSFKANAAVVLVAFVATVFWSVEILFCNAVSAAVLVASLASTSACTAAIAFEAAVAFAVTVAWSVAVVELTTLMFVSTYVFTAFCVGNKISLLPKVVMADLFAVFSFVANPGTVGAAAVPLKSPASWILPFVVEVASGMVAAATCVSTYVFTAFCVGYNTSLVPRVGVVDLLESVSLISRAAWVAIEIGFVASEVLSTLPKPRFIFASVGLFAPVPPLKIATVPDTLFAVSAA